MENIIKNLDWSFLTNIILSVVPALMCITVHEVSHGLAAYKLGDMTAKRMGRLTFNPIKHIDPFGLIMMIVCHFGWAKPVPVDMRNFKNPKRDMAITALAGPLSNIVFACVCMFVYGITYIKLEGSAVGSYVLQMVNITAYINIALAIFNFIPIPPLDGSKILFSLMSDESYMKLMRYERYGMILLAVIIISGVSGSYLSSAAGFVFNKLFVIAQWAFELSLKIM